MPDGKIQPEFVERLEAVGQWDKNGETIYGTHGGSAKPRLWGAMTRKDNRIYVRVLDWADEILALPDVGRIKRATLFAAQTPIEMRMMNGGMVLRIPTAMKDPVDTIVVLER